MRCANCGREIDASSYVRTTGSGEEIRVHNNIEDCVAYLRERVERLEAAIRGAAFDPVTCVLSFPGTG